MSFGLSNANEEEYNDLSEHEQHQQPPIADQRRRPAQRRPREEEEEKEFPRNARQRLEEDSEPEEPQQQFHSRSSLENISGDPGADPIGGGERKRQWKPYVPNMFDPLTLDQFEKEHIPDPNWCFLEWYSESSLREEEQAPIKKLFQLVKENWEKTSMPVLMMETQKYYNKEIREKYAALKDKVWPMRKIYEYFSFTSPDPTIMMEEERKTLWHAAIIISNHEMFEADQFMENGQQRVDYRINKDALMKFLKCTSRIASLMDKLPANRSRHQVG